jgi:hypothetical protein
MTKKIGRPTLPKGQSKAVQIGVRFTPKEGQQIQKAATEAGQSNAEWARDMLLNSARPIWVISQKWQSSDLHHKTVQFKFTSPVSILQGIGRFTVRQHRDRLRLAIEIGSTEQAGSGNFLTSAAC